jgi:D-alanyl-lipoteichoic acid acyltransferase DltB (MBOAT superfamily)
MLFNSTEFIFGFLPISIALYFLLGRASILAARVWLSVASLFFYAWWNPPYLILLAISIVFNFGVGYLLQNYTDIKTKLPTRKVILLAGLAFDLGFLGYFKYTAFL